MTEGVIKFNCEWIKDDALPFEVIKELNDARIQLFDKKLIGSDENGLGYGNISKRYEDRQFIISGSQTGGIRNTNENHYTLITEYEFERNYVQCTGPVIASSETMTHAALYELSTDINCVIHIHNKNIWENNIYKSITTSEKTQYGTPEMAEDIKKLYSHKSKSQKYIIMGGHEGGIIIYDISIGTALNNTMKLLI